MVPRKTVLAAFASPLKLPLFPYLERGQDRVERLAFLASVYAPTTHAEIRRVVVGAVQPCESPQVFHRVVAGAVGPVSLLFRVLHRIGFKPGSGRLRS